MTNFYSIEQVAGRLGVHVRTVRNFIREGRLSATRIGKQYRIADEDLAKMTGRPAASFEPRRTRHVEASSIVEIDAIDPETASRISNLAIAATNSRGSGDPPLRLETIYNEERAHLKVIIAGGVEDTVALLKMVRSLAQP